MVVAFLGTHVPLLALLFYFIISNSFSFGATIRILAITLLATLAGTTATLYALHNLLIPVILHLLLMNSQCDPLGTEARQMAVHARGALAAA